MTTNITEEYKNLAHQLATGYESKAHHYDPKECSEVVHHALQAQLKWLLEKTDFAPGERIDGGTVGEVNHYIEAHNRCRSILTQCLENNKE